MASSSSSRAVFVRALDELAVLSADNARDCIAKLHVMICEMVVMDDSLVGFDILDCLKESKELENNKLKALSYLIAQTEEAIRLKEGHVDVMDLEIHY
ncbi:hypothetical protein Tco_0973479 [Tanacetum coccineum]